MPRRLTKPSEVASDHRPLIDMLWRFYMAANSPSMKKVADTVTGLDDDQRAGTANHETVRRTLGGLALPQWQTVEVIFLALCQIANVDPDDDDDGDSDMFDRWDEQRTHRDRLQRFYQLARHGTMEDLPRTRAEKIAQQRAERERRLQPADDPWGTAPPAGSGSRFSDEPPF